MISVAEAVDIIKSNTKLAAMESIPSMQSSGRILRQASSANRPLPPFNRVMMDGICLKYSSFKDGLRTFPIQEVQAAGDPQIHLENSNHCIEIMTGAILPSGADTVIRYEDLQIEDGLAKVLIDQVNEGQNIHEKGTDRKAGELLMSDGVKLSAPEIGVLASLGHSLITVSKTPSCIIISTGDELVEVDIVPEDHQIRRSNVYMIKSELNKFAIEADQVHLVDDFDLMVEKIGGYLNAYDMIILSGGVSKGKFDHLPKVLEQLGVVKKFHKIKQRPGKPFWFGNHPEGAMVFALPGNPVSSFLCLKKYVFTYLNKHLGGSAKMQSIQLTENVQFTPDLDYFLPVSVEILNGQALAKPYPRQGSGDFANFLRADGFLHLPRGQNNFLAGDNYPYIPFRNFE